MRCKNPFLFGLLLALLVTVQSANLNALNPNCLCDVTDTCDDQCCCDSDCHPDFISGWRDDNLCTDDSLSIPFCSTLDGGTPNVLDLHSGLRTIYSVIKRLFCISSVSFVKPADWYERTPSIPDIQKQTSQALLSSSQTPVNPITANIVKASLSGLPLRSTQGLCYSSSQLLSNEEVSSSCRVYVPSAGSISNSLLSITFLEAALGTTLTKFTTNTVSTVTASPQNSLITSCTGNSCDNVVKELKIFINTENNSINSNSYLVVGPLEVSQAAYINLEFEYSFVSTEGLTISFPFSSFQGYTFGSPLTLLYFDNTDYFKMFNPLSLAFQKPDGSCRTVSSDSAAFSSVKLKFGLNQIFSCKGSNNLIYQNLKQTLTHVGRLGLSSTVLSDYVSISYPTGGVSNTESVQVLVYYLKIGASGSNLQYQISRVDVNAVTSKDGLSSLFIEYVQVQNSETLFIPSPPKVDAYLPNDFLYPFYVA